MLRNFHCHMTHLKYAWNKIRSHGTFSLSVHKMLANLFDLWKIGNNRKRDPSKEEHPTVRWRKSNSKNSNQRGKKNFPGLNLTRRKLYIGGQLCVGINGSSTTCFRCDSLVSHEKSHSHYFCFQWSKNKEKPEQALLQQIAVKSTKSQRETGEPFQHTTFDLIIFFWQVHLT